MDAPLHQFRALMVDARLFDNEAWRFAALFTVLLLSFIAGRTSRYLLTKVAERSRADGRAIFAAWIDSFAKSAEFLFFTVGLSSGLACLVLHDAVASLADVVTDALTVVALGWTLFAQVDVVEAWMRRSHAISSSRMSDTLVRLVGRSLRVTVIVMTVVHIATVLSDKPAASILAGLGVGGLAMALAAQETVKNLFGSLVILGDKPFEIGERIVVDQFDGSVERVGFRSTRIRLLDGALVTIPNGELANKFIQNMDKRPHIRRIANLSITYDTPPEKVRRAKEILEEILRNHEGMKPDFPPRVHFNEFNNASLNLIIHYWYHPADYWKYMDFSERVNAEILARFNAEGINFAFPTQTLHLAGNAMGLPPQLK